MQLLEQRSNNYLLYSPLCEGDNESEFPSWDKETVKYATEHKNHLLHYIESTCNIKSSSKRKTNKDDYDDIYEDLIIFLYNHRDYSEELAYNREKGSLIDVKSYVEIMTGYMCQTFLQNEGKRNRNKVEQIQVVGDEEVNILDNTKDDKRDIKIEDFISLRDILQQNLCNRYFNNVDIYLVWYVRISTEDDGIYNKVLNVLNINKNSIKTKHKSENKLNELMKSIAKAVSIEGIDAAKETLREYVYTYNDIDRLIQLI